MLGAASVVNIVGRPVWAFIGLFGPKFSRAAYSAALKFTDQARNAVIVSTTPCFPAVYYRLVQIKLMADPGKVSLHPNLVQNIPNLSPNLAKLG